MTAPALFPIPKPTRSSKWFARIRPVIYIQLSASQVTFKSLKAHKSFSDSPHMALSNGPDGQLIEGIGEAAFAAAAIRPLEVVNPFGHPRSLLSDFTLAEYVFRHFFKQVRTRWALRPPAVVVHPIGEFEGGLTQIEMRVMQELTIAAGASNAQIWVGRELTDGEILRSPTLFTQQVVFRPALPARGAPAVGATPQVSAIDETASVDPDVAP